MKNNKFWLAGIAGGVANFLLGWLIYGMLLKNFMETHCGLSPELQAQVNKPEAEFNWAALIASNILGGYLLALILAWGNKTGFGKGMTAGLIIGFLLCANMDLFFFSMTRMHTMESMLVDIVVGTIMTGIVGGVVGMVLGKGNSSAS